MLTCLLQVKWANHNNVAFKVKNRGHGMTHSPGGFNGIEINMSELRNIDIQPDGKTAWFQGGTYGGETMDYLWERGYVASEFLRIHITHLHLLTRSQLPAPVPVSA